jgi:hypothetical protein
MKRSGHVARIRDLQNAYILVENLKGRYSFRDLGVDWCIVLKMSFKNGM